MDSFVNSSNTNGTSSAYSPEAIGLGVGYALLSVVGIAGNGLVLIAVAFSKSLQTTSNVFIVNLAVADLLTSLVFPSFVIAGFADYRPYLDTMCFVALAIAHTTIGCSIYTLASIAINRFVLILSPMKYYRDIFKPKVFTVWVTFLWICPVLIAVFPPVALDIGKLAFDGLNHNCRPKTTVASSALYDNLLIYGYFPIPLSIIMVSYIGIFIKVLRHNRRMSKQSLTLTLYSSGRQVISFHYLQTSDEYAPIRRSHDAFQRQLKITRNMFYIFCAFLVCYLPHTICNFTDCRIGAFTRLFVSTNSVVNPFIYGISHPHFRKVFGEILGCKSSS
ncbi:Rhodopsin, GQ-coupled [Holothuria leucospilota]|uniref:Rhodopsin, GQ-coupled n=1 Tax=Holothuria leucospilota TaxID=206669 RepID=A0A9Q1BTX5_HOLLE|nr:Rhodopsin, GQ-coupled [Holothuria leucospilota]